MFLEKLGDQSLLYANRVEEYVKRTDLGALKPARISKWFSLHQVPANSEILLFNSLGTANSRDFLLM